MAKESVLEHAFQNQQDKSKLGKQYRKYGVYVYDTGSFENGERVHYFATGLHRKSLEAKNPHWKLIYLLGPVEEAK